MKNPAQYEKLRAKGMSKQRAAAITNSVNKALTQKQHRRRGLAGTAAGIGVMAPSYVQILRGRSNSKFVQPKVLIPLAGASIGASLYGGYHHAKGFPGIAGPSRKVQKDIDEAVEKALSLGGVARAIRTKARVPNTIRSVTKPKEVTAVWRSKGPGSKNQAPGHISTTSTTTQTKGGSITARQTVTGKAPKLLYTPKRNIETTQIVHQGGKRQQTTQRTTKPASLTHTGRYVVGSLAAGGAGAGGATYVANRRVQKSSPDQADAYVHGSLKPVKKIRRKVG